MCYLATISFQKKENPQVSVPCNCRLVCVCVLFCFHSRLTLKTLETLQKCGPQFLTATQPSLKLMKTESALGKSRSVLESDNPGFKPRLHHLIGCVILCKSFKTAETHFSDNE